MRRYRRPWKSAVYRHILAVLEGVFWMACGGLLLSLLLLKLGAPPAMLMRILTQILWCMGAFLSGRRAGSHGRRHGIRTGLICGALLCSILASGAVLLHEVWHMEMLLRMVLILMAGAIGGIIGVNTRIKHHRTKIF